VWYRRLSRHKVVEDGRWLAERPRLGRDLDPAATAMEAVADQSLPLEVPAARPSAIREVECNLHFVVFQIRLIRAWLIRFRRCVIVVPARILEAGERTVHVYTNGIATVVGVTREPDVGQLTGGSPLEVATGTQLVLASWGDLW